MQVLTRFIGQLVTEVMDSGHFCTLDPPHAVFKIGPFIAAWLYWPLEEHAQPFPTPIDTSISASLACLNPKPVASAAEISLWP